MNESQVDLLYEEGPCLVVNKPPGILTQAPPGIDSLEVRIKDFLKRREGTLDEVYLGVPHRLDRPASGAIVFCTRVKATRRLAQQFEARLVRKAYWACVEGHVAPGEGIWENYLRKIPDRARAEVVDADHPQGRRAVLQYRVRATAQWGTWLEIELQTGRTHQIRVQAGWRGHPVLGDTQYGSTTPFGPQHEDHRLRAIALHARSITFRHPKTQQRVTVTASAPEYWPDVP